MRKQKKKSTVPYAPEEVILLDMALQPEEWALAKHGDEVMFGYYYLGYDYRPHILDLGLMPAQMPAAYAFYLNLRAWHLMYQDEVVGVKNPYKYTQPFSDWLEEKFSDPSMQAVYHLVSQIAEWDGTQSEQYIQALALIKRGTRI